MTTTRTNNLLASLPRADFERLLPSLETVQLNLGLPLYEGGIGLEYAYFPIDCIVSLLNVMEDGDSSEVAIVGNQGVVGTSLFMGGDSTISRAVVQSGGTALRMKVTVLREEFKRSGPFQDLLLRYTQALMSLIFQTAACNRHHSVPVQLSRWLLMSLDRLPSNTVIMTPGLIANMLGVRLEGMIDASSILQSAGLITYDDGKVTMLDRPGLEKYVCECYAIVNKEFARLLPARV